jgi:hypothetical protein
MSSVPASKGRGVPEPTLTTLVEARRRSGHEHGRHPGDVRTGAITSLDGYIEDANGRFDWAVPDEDVHRFVNDLERSVGTYLYGRRM